QKTILPNVAVCCTAGQPRPLEPDPRQQSSGPLPGAGRKRIDAPESGDGITVSLDYRRRKSVSRRWSRNLQPVKHIGKFGAKLQSHAFLYLESTRQRCVLHRMSLLPIIGVIRSRGSEL